MYESLLKPILATLALLGGAAAVVAILLARIRRRRQRRKEEGHRTPLEEKLLRPAGYSAGERVEALTDEFLDAGLVAAVGGAGATASILYAVQFVWRGATAGAGPGVRDPISGVIALVIYGGGFALSLAVIVRQARRFQRLDDERANWRLGARGEQRVAEILNDPAILAAGYRIYHDVPGAEDWNIDHVVVGPGGVYVIETKARTKRPGDGGQASHKVRYDGQSLRFPDWDDRKTLGQVKANVEWLRRWLGDPVSKDLTFHAVVVLPGWFVETVGRYEVKVMNDRYLKGFLPREPRTFDQAILSPVLSKLDERCRTLEV